MKTTMNIHLAQRLIIIDTDAWQSLELYLNALKKYFATQESGDEIYADIENRVSEIMNQQLKSGKVSISNDDVAEIIEKVGDLKTLGIVEENTIPNENINTTATNSNATNNQNGNTNQQYNIGKKRLLRNGNDKIISGLCSGVANYLNIDPIWVRLVFLFLLLPAGIGFLAYILGSIFIPKSYDAVFNAKRLFRDTDNKVIGGVCSGIAAYINTNPNYIRVLFLSPIIISIIASGGHHWHNNDAAGFVNVPFFGIYILLLILLPKAKSASEKLQMRGEQVNVNSIRNQVNGNAAPRIQNSSAGSIIGGIAKLFMYCIIGFFLFVISMVGIALFSSGTVVMQFSDYLFRNGHQTMLANFGWILFCGIPIIFVILLIVKKVNGRSDYLPSNTFSYLGLAWIFGLFCLIALSREFYKDFKFSKTLPAIANTTNAFTSNTMRVKLATKTIDDALMIGNVSGIHLMDDSAIIGNVSIKIEKSVDENYHYSTSLFTRGNSDADINTRLQNVQYTPLVSDSTMVLPLGYVLKKGQLWRGQKINLTIYVPEGKQILIEDAVDNNYSSIELNTNPGNFNIHSYNDFDYDTDKWYTMKANGLYNENDELEKKQSDVEDAKEELEQAAEEVTSQIEEAKEEIKNGLEEAKDELTRELANENTPLSKEDVDVMKNKISKLQSNLDSLQLKLDVNKNVLIDKAKEALEKAKQKLEEKKTK
jgi:phage shock protein PspC (stress-responsive transcriptional regulator)